jgi:dihydroxy-acid dehydratase
MLFATEGVDTDADLEKPMVGVASIWYEGNPCVRSIALPVLPLKRSLQV